MPIMQKAGYSVSLPFDVQSSSPEEMQIPMSDIYGVATFYSSLEPKGKHVIGIDVWVRRAMSKSFRKVS